MKWMYNFDFISTCVKFKNLLYVASLTHDIYENLYIYI